MEQKHKQLHAHHRQRMKERFLKNGFDGFEEHEVLEFLLFYAIPRQYTNEQAHRLIEKFGSVSKVFDASVQRLMEVEGIGMHSALLISSMRELFRIYRSDCVSNIKSIDDYDRGGEYFTALFSGTVEERIILVCLDGANKIISTDTLSKGNCNSAAVSIRDIASLALKNNAGSIILAHNHPSGTCLPSSDDLNVTSMVRKTLQALDITLKEHYIVSGNNYVGIVKIYDNENKHKIIV